MFNNNYYPYYYPQQQRLNNLEQQYPQFANNNNFMPNIGQMNNQQVQPQPMQNVQPQPQLVLQGKAVDSIEVVKATDVPLDGSITYFPKTDGTAIYTKQLQTDGTSKLTIYKATTDESNTSEPVKEINYLKKEDIEKIYEDISDVKKSIAEAMDDLFYRFDEFRDEISNKLKEEKKQTTTTRGVRK